MAYVIYLILLVSLDTGEEGANVQKISSHIHDIPESNYTNAVRQGKETLQEYESRVGPCWMRAVEDLPSKWSETTDVGRHNLAINLTNCHFEAPGEKVYEYKDEAKFQQCAPRIKTIENSSFLAHTEFSTQVADMCSYLQSATWREKPAKIIALVSQTTEDAISKLDHSLRIQETVLHNQKKLVMIQEENAQRAKNAKKAIPYPKHTSEYMAFYTVAFALCYVVTSTQITIKARPYIFILFASLALVEKILIEVALKYDDILRSTIVCFSLLPLFSSLCAFSNVN